MQYYLCDPDQRDMLYPFSRLHHFADIRLGLWTNKERYAAGLNEEVFALHKAEDYSIPSVFVNARFIADAQLCDAIKQLQPGEALMLQDEIIAIALSDHRFSGFQKKYEEVRFIPYEGNLLRIVHSFDLLRLNQLLLEHDIRLCTLSDARAALSVDNKVFGVGKIVAAASVKATGAFFNTEQGSIFLGKNVQVMEGACLRGPIAILDNSVVKMGSKIYGSTLIGKKCVVGGEIKNSIFFDYSNKAHDGYIGDSVIGSWCNMGAGTSCSNLKNNAGEIALWNPVCQEKVVVGNKCGVMMGDYTRTAINTSLNSGTVTGICCHIVKAGFPPKYIPDFTWDTDTKELYSLQKLVVDVERWMALKNETLEEENKQLLLQLYHHSLTINR